MSDYIEAGNLKKKKSKDIFITNSNKESTESKDSYVNEPVNDTKTKQKPGSNLQGLVNGELTFETLESDPVFNTFKSELPLAMQGLSLRALKTYYLVKNKSLEENGNEYLNEERSEWIEKFHNKLERSRGIKFTDNDEDEYQAKTFSQVAKELSGHWNVNPSPEYTIFKDSVLDFEGYINTTDFDMKEYSSKYHLAISTINQYIDSHKGAISPWGRKRLRMARSLRAKMQLYMDPDKFLLEKFENLGAIELKNIHQGIDPLHAKKAPEYSRMTEESGNLGMVGAKIIGYPVSGDLLIQNKDGNYTHKPITNTILNSVALTENPIQKKNLRRMYNEVNKKSKEVNGKIGITKDFFAKSLIVSTLTSKIKDSNDLIHNPEKIREDIIHKKEENISIKKQKIKELKEEEKIKESKLKDVNLAYENEVKETKGQENSLNIRINELESKIKSLNENKKVYQDKIDGIKSRYSDSISKFDDENHPLNVEIKAMEKINNLNESNASDFEDSLSGFKSKKSLELDTMEDRVKNLSNLVNSYKNTFDKKNKNINDINGQIESKEKELQAKREKLLNPEYQKSLKGEYASYKKIVDSNPILKKQRDIVFDINLFKNNFYLSLITGNEASELIRKHDEAFFKRTHISTYKKFYNNLCTSKLPELQKMINDYKNDAKKHNEKADVFNRMVEEKTRKNLGLGPNTPMPKSATIHYMAKMEDTEEITKALSIDIPDVETILDKNKRDNLILNINKEIDSNKYDKFHDTGMPVEINTYQNTIEQLNSDKFSEINLKKNIVIDSLTKEKDILTQKLDEAKSDLLWYQDKEKEDKVTLSNLQKDYNELRLKEIRNYCEHNLSKVKKELENQKNKVINERDKAIEKESVELNSIIGEINDHSKNISKLKERIDNLGNRKNLSREIENTKRDLEDINQNIEKETNALKNIEENEDENKAFSTIEKSQKEYLKDTSKLSIMNDALAQFFLVSEGTLYTGGENEESYEEKKAVYNEFSKLNLQNMVNLGNNSENIKTIMANFIHKYGNISAKQINLEISKEDAMNMAETALSLYSEIVQNIA